MRRLPFIVTVTALLFAAATVRAAELEIPPPARPKDVSVYVNQPNCMRWTDECVNCTRGVDGKGPSCSNIGFACQPKAVRCIGHIPQGEPDKK